MALSEQEVLAGLAEIVAEETGIDTGDVQLRQVLHRRPRHRLAVDDDDRHARGREVRRPHPRRRGQEPRHRRRRRQLHHHRTGANASPLSAFTRTRPSRRNTMAVVVTGLGAPPRSAGTCASTWEAALAGRSGVRTLENDWAENVRPAGDLRRPDRRRPRRGPHAPRDQAHGPLRAVRDHRHARGMGRRGLARGGPRAAWRGGVVRHRRRVDAAHGMGHGEGEGRRRASFPSPCPC